MVKTKKSSATIVVVILVAIILALRFGTTGLEAYRTHSLDGQAQKAGLTTSLAALDLGPAPDPAQNRAVTYHALFSTIWKDPTLADQILNVTSAIGNSYNTRFRVQLDPTADSFAKAAQAANCNFRPSTSVGVIPHELPHHSQEEFTEVEMLWRMGRLLSDRAEYRLLTGHESDAIGDAKAAMIIANDVAAYPWSFARFWGEGLQRRLLTMIGLRGINNPNIPHNLQIASLMVSTYKPAPPLPYTLSGDFTYLKTGIIQADLSSEDSSSSIGSVILGTPSDITHAAMKAIIGLQTGSRNRNCIGRCVQEAEDAMGNSDKVGGVVAVKGFEPFSVMDLPADTLTTAVLRMLRQSIAIIKIYKSTHTVPKTLPLTGDDSIDPVTGYPIAYIPDKASFKMWTLRYMTEDLPDQELVHQRLNTVFTWNSDQIPSP